MRDIYRRFAGTLGAPRARPGGLARRTTEYVAATLLSIAVVCILCLIPGSDLLGIAGIAGTKANAAPLPDHRVYELVSPSNKGGSDVLIDSGRTRVAADGSAIQFPSLGAFGDARGTSYATEYISIRNATTGRWATHGVTPLQSPQPGQFAAAAGLDLRYVGEFTSALTQGVFLSNRLLNESDTGTVHAVPNLYLREDLRTRGPGKYRLLTAAPEPVTANQSYRPWFAGSSDDFSHVVFSSTLTLTANAPTQPSPALCISLGACDQYLYEWVDGLGVRFVGLLPEEEGGGPAERSIAGAGWNEGVYTPNVISRNGRRIFFTAYDPGLLDAGRLYMRLDGSETIRVNASERDVPDDEQPARYESASADGRFVYFTTSEGLTDDDNDRNVDLYRADMASSSGSRLTLVSFDHEPVDGDSDIQRVLAVDEGGDHVFFISLTQLVAGASLRPATGELLLFEWHSGQTTYIGNVSITDSPEHSAAAGWNLTHKMVQVTPNGRFLLFTSRAQIGLTGDDPGACAGPSWGCREVYVFDTTTKALMCASCRPDGGAALADAETMSRANLGATSSGASTPRAISDDGRRVFFTTADPLVTEDQNGMVEDVYMYNVPNDEVHLVSSGKSISGSFFIGASSSGDDLFFVTRERLSGSDSDANYDIYDARVNGVRVPFAVTDECEGARCQGSAPTPPSDEERGTGALGGTRGGRVDVTPWFNARPLTKRALRRLAAGRRGQVHVRVSDPGRVLVRLRARIDGRVRVVGRAVKHTATAGTAEVTVRVGRRGLRRLEAAGRLRMTVLVAFSPVAGLESERVTLVTGDRRAW